MQFAAGLLVVLDLVGPERLRRTAERLATVRHRADLSWYRLVQGLKAKIEKGSVKTAVLLLLVCILPIVGVAVFLVSIPSFWGSLDGPRWLLIPGAFGIFLIALKLVDIVIFGPVRLTLRILTGLSRTLENFGPYHPLRWIGFGVFCVGFFFDLLSS
jgi:hypothetical protein